jgi:hypothetical protein
VLKILIGLQMLYYHVKILKCIIYIYVYIVYIVYVEHSIYSITFIAVISKLL